MTEGVFVESLGSYLLVDQREGKVRRVYFSAEKPMRASRLAEEIVAHLEEGSACPKPELDLTMCTAFQKGIYAAVQSISRGKTKTYGQVAADAGSPGAARAVGRAMAANPFAVLVPCHRVVARDGPGGYAFGREIKEKLLKLERGPP